MKTAFGTDPMAIGQGYRELPGFSTGPPAARPAFHQLRGSADLRIPQLCLLEIGLGTVSSFPFRESLCAREAFSTRQDLQSVIEFVAQRFLQGHVPLLVCAQPIVPHTELGEPGKLLG